MMIDLIDDCEMLLLSEEQLISDFDCGNMDLNDFFIGRWVFLRNLMDRVQARN